MNKKLAMAALVAMVSVPVVTPAPALAQDGHYDRDANYDHHHRAYHGRGGHYRCNGGNGAVGTVAGGVGGAVLGNALGGGTLGTVAGGVGGALLGRHLDKKHTEAKNGC